MLSIRAFIFGLLTLCFSVNLYSQKTIRENDYSINYLDKNIELVFDVPVFIKAFDATTKTALNVIVEGNKANSFIINDVLPAQIIKVEYSYLYGKNYDVQTTYIANQSLSTGTINVYFNHPVDTSVAQTQNAVNLGNTLDDMLISYINACVSTLDIAIYNSYSASGTTGIAGAINAAYTRGVQVRVIYDGSTSSVMIPLLNPSIPKLASPNSSSYGIMHNKFVLFDATNTNPNLPYVWTGSTNWTTAQIDGPDKNNAIVIQDQALALGYKIEFEEMWGSTTMTPNTTLSKFGPDKTDNTPHTYLIGGKTVNSYFSPSDGVNSKIIAAINSANSDIDIATMLITRSDISTALINKYNGGLTNLYLVLDSQNPTGNQTSTLQSGINTSQVVTYTLSGIMHHKFMCIDNFNSSSDPQVLVGSHNWSNSAENRNDENTLIVHDANITNQYYQAFVYLYGQAGGVLSTNESVITKENFVLYPNPTNGIFYITAKENSVNDNVVVRIYDVLGNKVLDKYSTNLTNESIDLSNQASGMYFVDVVKDGKEVWFKVVKE
jgi:phosphatidylserine/phosphatidylglycerophosphate/cardiolipin synthase-like enzyme